MKTSLVIPFAIVGLAVASSSMSTRILATDWPSWMGPNLDGISHQDDWSEDWPAEGLEQVWEKQIGIGFSSISGCSLVSW